MKAPVWIVRLMLAAILASLMHAPAMAFGLSAPCPAHAGAAHHAAAASADHPALSSASSHHPATGTAPCCCATPCVAAILPSAPDFAATTIVFRAAATPAHPLRSIAPGALDPPPRLHLDT